MSPNQRQPKCPITIKIEGSGIASISCLSASHGESALFAMREARWSSVVQKCVIALSSGTTGVEQLVQGRAHSALVWPTGGLTGAWCSYRVYVQSRGARTKQGSPPEAAIDGGRIAGYAGRSGHGWDRKARPRPLRGVDVAERPVMGSHGDVAGSSGLFLCLPHLPLHSGSSSVSSNPVR
jgi:hypothetical protein